MTPERNIDRTGRLLRGIAGIWLLAMAVSAYRVGRRQTALATAIAGLGLVQNAWTGFCGGNWLLGIDSTDSCTR